MPVNEEMVERAYNRFMQANSETVDCPGCSGKGYHHGFGEHGHDPDWCLNCGGPGCVPKFDEMSAVREALIAALSDQVVVPREVIADMLDSWSEAAQYKGDYLLKKHGDKDEIAKYRAMFLAPPPASPAEGV